MPLLQKNPGPLLVDKLKGFYGQLPEWVKSAIPIRVEKQKVDAKTAELDPLTGARIASELQQEVTDEKLKVNRYIDSGTGDGELPPGFWPQSHPGQVVLSETGQVATSNEVLSDQPQSLVEGPPLQAGSVEQIGDLSLKKSVEAPTFDRKAFQKSVEDLMPPEFRAAIPQQSEQHTVDGEAAMPTLGATDLSRREAQEKVGVKQTTRQWRDTGTPAVLVGQRIDPEFNGAKLNLDKRIVADSTQISQGFGVTGVKILPYDDKNAVRETWTAVGGFPHLQQHNYDSEINAMVTTVVQIVPHADVFVPDIFTLDYNERKIDAVHKMRVFNTPVSLPTEVTFETRPFNFPALLLTLNFQLVETATANKRLVQWTAGTRASFTVPTRHQINTTWHAANAKPSPSATISWAPGDITFKGASYSIGLTNLLFNSWTDIGVTYPGDIVYGNVVDRFSVSATSPSASTYIGWIGTQQCISSTVTRYKRLWVKRDVYVVIR